MLAPTAASAYYYGSETDYGKQIATLPDNDYYRKCTWPTGVLACFQPYGDIFFVKDDRADGYAAAVDWYDADSNRWGSCVNTHTAGTWAECNKDFVEGHTIYFRGALYQSGNRVGNGGWVSVVA
jgi:hypothetical protein